MGVLQLIGKNTSIASKELECEEKDNVPFNVFEATNALYIMLRNSMRHSLASEMA